MSSDNKPAHSSPHTQIQGKRVQTDHTNTHDDARLHTYGAHLFLPDGHVRGDVGKHSGLNEVALSLAGGALATS